MAKRKLPEQLPATAALYSMDLYSCPPLIIQRPSLKKDSDTTTTREDSPEFPPIEWISGSDGPSSPTPPLMFPSLYSSSSSSSCSSLRSAQQQQQQQRRTSRALVRSKAQRSNLASLLHHEQHQHSSSPPSYLLPPKPLPLSSSIRPLLHHENHIPFWKLGHDSGGERIRKTTTTTTTTASKRGEKTPFKKAQSSHKMTFISLTVNKRIEVSSST